MRFLYVPSIKLRFEIRLRDFSLIFAVEPYGIFCAVKYVIEGQWRYVTIFSDTQNAIYDYPFLDRLIGCRTASANRLGVTIRFVWIPAQVGVPVYYYSLSKDHSNGITVNDLNSSVGVTSTSGWPYSDPTGKQAAAIPFFAGWQ